jgi:hypothetical protein
MLVHGGSPLQMRSSDPCREINGRALPRFLALPLRNNPSPARRRGSTFAGRDPEEATDIQLGEFAASFELGWRADKEGGTAAIGPVASVSFCCTITRAAARQFFGYELLGHDALIHAVRCVKSRSADGKRRIGALTFGH